MLWIVLIVVAVVVIGGLVAMLSSSTDGDTSGSGSLNLYYKQKSLLTQAERTFYPVLKGVVGVRYGIHAKVRMADLVGVKHVKGHHAAFNRISARHADFVLVEPETLEPKLIIELDDSSHDRPDRSDRDRQVDAIYRSVGLPILHLPLKQGWNPRDLSAAIHTALSGTQLAK